MAIETDHGITVFELLGGYDVDKGDVFSGNLESLGGETFFNESKQEKMDVFVQGIYCSMENARQMLSS